MPKFLIEIELHKPGGVWLHEYIVHIQEAVYRWGSVVKPHRDPFFPSNIKQVKVTSEPDETKLDSHPG